MKKYLKNDIFSIRFIYSIHVIKALGSRKGWATPRLVSFRGLIQNFRRDDLYDKIGINIRSLKALGIESESFGNLLVPVVMEKIPSELRLIISRKFGSKETWDLDVLLNALKSELEARERCNAVKTISPTNSNPH